MKNLVSFPLVVSIAFLGCNVADEGDSDGAAGAHEATGGAEHASGGQGSAAGAQATGGAERATGGQGQAAGDSGSAGAGGRPGPDAGNDAGAGGPSTSEGTGGNGLSENGGSAGAANDPHGQGGEQAGGAGSEADPHGGASRFVDFGHDFVKCTWFDADLGFCSEAAKSLEATTTIGIDLYKTTDGGRSWSLVSSIDGGNSTAAAMSVFVLSPTEIWYITGFTGFGFSGTIGRSTDGGASFASLTDAVDLALADPEQTEPLEAPLYDLAKVGDAIWLNTGSWSQYLAMSPDGGTTWGRVLGPVDLSTAQAPEFIATHGGLMLRYVTADWGLELYRLGGTEFVPVEGTFPAPSGSDHGDTWWRATPNAAGVALADQRQWPFWTWPFLVTATFDLGATFETVYSGSSQTESGCEGLRDVAAYSLGSGTVVYVSGVFLDGDGNRFVEIRKSTDKGSSWTTLHSEPENGAFVSVALDPTGKVHAMRHWTDAYGNTYVYDGQYVLE